MALRARPGHVRPGRRRPGGRRALVVVRVGVASDRRGRAGVRGGARVHRGGRGPDGGLARCEAHPWTRGPLGLRGGPYAADADRARSAGVRNGITIHSQDDLPSVLPDIDALVMILPGSDATKHVLNAERLKLLPRHAWIVNVGRGTSVDEAALDAALSEGSIGGAALDVFETEPLPGSSPLYKQKDVILSPHAAGGRPQGAEALIAENLRKFIAGQQLKNVI